MACGIFSSSMQSISYSMCDLVYCPGTKPKPSGLQAQSLNHWTIREVAVLFTVCVTLGTLHSLGFLICKMGMRKGCMKTK